MPAKLKPCPLCGNPVKIFSYMKKGYWIRHGRSSCDCGITFELDHDHRGGVMERAAIIKAWNTRVTS